VARSRCRAGRGEVVLSVWVNSRRTFLKKDRHPGRQAHLNSNGTVAMSKRKNITEDGDVKTKPLATEGEGAKHGNLGGVTGGKKCAGG